MKFMIVCILALAATSLAGNVKKEKRGLLPHNEPVSVLGLTPNYLPQNVQLPLEIAPVQHAQLRQHNTFSVERINVQVPYPVEKTVVKHVHVDRPVPQPIPVQVVKTVPEPYAVQRLIPQPYPVEVKIPVEQPVAVPFDRVRTVVQRVEIPQQTFPVYHQQQAHIQEIAQPNFAQAYDAQPAYAQQVFAQPAYAQQTFAQPPYAQQTFAQPAIAQQILGQPDFAQHAAVPAFTQAALAQPTFANEQQFAPQQFAVKQWQF